MLAIKIPSALVYGFGGVFSIVVQCSVCSYFKIWVIWQQELRATSLISYHRDTSIDQCIHILGPAPETSFIISYFFFLLNLRHIHFRYTSLQESI